MRLRTGLRAAIGLVSFAAILNIAGCGNHDETISSPAPPSVRSEASALTVLSRTGWTASASITDGTNTAAKAIDGSSTTHWGTGFNQAVNNWFQVDMGTPQTFVEVAMDSTGTVGTYPGTFQVQVSTNGSSWTSVCSATGTLPLTTCGFPAQTARYVRVNITAATNRPWTIYEFNVYGAPLTRTGWTATASSTLGTNAAANAIDASTTTFWETSAAQTGQSFIVDMKSPQTFNQLILNAGSGSLPAGYSISVSSDMSNWGPAIASGTSTASPMVINFATQFARYFRILQTGASVQWSLADLNVYGQPTTAVSLPRTGWVASASVSASGTTPAMALDGSTTTSWKTNSSPNNQYLKIDMQALHEVSQLTVDSGNGSSNILRAYSIYASNDGTTWGTPVAQSSSNSATAVTVTFTPALTTRYFKVVDTSTNTTAWAVQELKVFGDVLQRTGWVALVTSSNGMTDAAANMLDGNSSTRWSSGQVQVGNESVIVDMQISQTFNQVILDAGTGPGGFPAQYSISVSNDNVTYGPELVTAVGTQVVTANFLTQTARYVRIKQVGSNSTDWWVIYELYIARIAQPCDTTTCTASDACHNAGTCSPQTGACSLTGTPAPDGTACNSADLCVRGESCQSGICQRPPATVCTAGSNITLYHSYDNGATLDIGDGSKVPFNAVPVITTGGLFGVAEDSSTDPALLYEDETGKKIELGKPGSISYWMKVGPSGALPAEATIFDPYTRSNLYVGDNGGALVAFADGADTTATYQGIASSVPVSSMAGDGKWHLLVVNWGPDKIGLSVDGSPLVYSGLGWQQPNHVYGTGVGAALYLGGSYLGGGARDELLFLNRPMTNEEIQWYYTNAKNGGPAGANPAIAYFSGTTTACNLWDDFNPCTVDSCNATTGLPSPSSVADGTVCSDGNACNGGEACLAGVCTGGATPPAQPTNDGNSCTTDSCDTVTGVVKNDPLADGTACDDGDPTTLLTSCVSTSCQPKVEGPNYAQLIDLGMVNPGDVQTYANGINASGDVVGEEDAQLDTGPGYIAFRYTNAGRKQQVTYSVPNPMGLGINASGTMVGYSISRDQTTTSAFIAAGGATVATALFPGSANSIAYAINDAGQVVGVNDSVSTYGYRLSGGPGGTLLPIPAPAGAEFTGTVWAESIGPGGEVVGSAMRQDYSIQFDDGFVLALGGQLYNAFRYTDAGGSQNLNDYATANGWQFLLDATATNGNQTVGWGVIHGRCHAFRYTVGTNQVVDLGTLSPPEFASAETCPTADTYNLSYYPRSINSHGEIVGYAGFGGDFYYSENVGMVNLQDVVDPALAVTLAGVAGINDNDEIAGDMYINGMLHAYRMKLPPSVTTCNNVNVEDGDPCTADKCDLATGLAVHTAAAVDDGDPCTADSCNSTSGVVHTPIACTPALVTPSLIGIAQVGTTTKAVFDYIASAAVSIPYGPGESGPANALYSGSTFLPSPTEIPPTTFLTTAHSPFVATLFGSSLTWHIGNQSAIATMASPQLPVTGAGDGSHDATLPDGTRVSLDSLPPAQPTAANPPPVGPAFNGTLTGQFGVSPSGAAQYSVPISIPPGIAGMAPNLSLTYSSQGGDGLAGQGWSLTGLSTITRCPRTRQQDGYARAVLLDSLDPMSNPDGKSDGICLDGVKLVETAPGTYSTEKQDFSTITLDGTGAFQVATKAGETRYYGRAAATRVASTQTAVWLLDRVVDAWGNYFDIQYNHGNGPDVSNAGDSFLATGIWPTQILYTGTLTNPACSGPTPDPSCTFASVTFQYQSRTKWRWTRYGSIKLPENQLLSSITTGLTSTTTGQGTYLLSYRPEDGRSPELYNIKYCSGSNCTRDMVFTWQDVKPTDFPVPGGGAAPQWDWTSNPAYAPPSGVEALYGLQGTQFVDVDGDGRLDLVVGRTSAPGGPQLATFLNTGNGWGPPLGTGKTFPLYLADQNFNPTGVRFADFDGDGRIDVMVDSANVKAVGDEFISCAPGDGNCGGTHYSPAVWLNRFSPGGAGRWVFATAYTGLDSNNIKFTGSNPTLVADLDGDGAADLAQVAVTTDVLNGHNQVVIPGFTRISVLLNKSLANPPPPIGTTMWGQQSIDYQNSAVGFSYAADSTSTFHLADFNRDGLADLVYDEFYKYSSGSVDVSEIAILNLGPGASSLFGTPVIRTAQSSGTLIDTRQYSPHYADLEGDGFYDAVRYAPVASGNAGTTGGPLGYELAVGYGNGTGFAFGGFTPTLKYSDVLTTYSPTVGHRLDAYTYALVDIDGDGLVDLVRNHPSTGYTPPDPVGGEILLNTGKTWVSATNSMSWQDAITTPSQSYERGRIPAIVPGEATTTAGSAFIDLDGDGLPDLVQFQAGDTDGPPNAQGGWINPYRVPMITGFYAGLAAPTNVAYVSTASAAGATTYLDDDRLEDAEPNTKLLALPLTVVSSTSAENGRGTGDTSTKTYTYHSLRQDSNGRGPLGFHRVETLESASNVHTITTYAQAYPFTGNVTAVEKYQRTSGEVTQEHLVSRTTTDYCFTLASSPGTPTCGAVAPGPFPGGTSVLVYADAVTDVACLRPEADNCTDNTNTQTTYQFDELGNAKLTTVAITKTEGGVAENFTKSVQNLYGDPLAAAEGRPTTTTTIGTGGTQSRSHTTTFDYVPVSSFGGLSSSLVALSKTHVEPGTSAELDTVYRYDQFGNVRETIACASDFTICDLDHTANPNSMADPVNSPPFRRTLISYDPAVLGKPVSYGVGQFPSQTTNAAGHVETMEYDPILGKAVTKTGPNNIQTCYAYDLLGRLTSQKDRCHSSAELTTTTQYFLTLRSWDYNCAGKNVPPEICLLPPGFSPANSSVVVVTTPPTGASTWSYSDDQGKPTGTLAYAFDGGFVETTASYTPLGQVETASKPFHITSVSDSGAPLYTHTWYDQFNRVETVTDPLDVIDSSGTLKSTTISTTYSGSTIETDRVVHDVTGQTHTQTRKETKNAIGKVSSVATQTETGLSAISYLYDADGNLTTTTDPAMNTVTMGYDAQGRKSSMIDPDMGTWGYLFNGFGDLVTQTDANQLTVTMAYDALGRMLTKSDPISGMAQWIYDTAPGAGKGKLAAMIGAPDPKLGTCPLPAGTTMTVTEGGGQRAVKTYQYTAFGEVQEADECADGTTFATTFAYDLLGRQSQIRYPMVQTSQLAVGYHYTNQGYLQYLTDDSADFGVLWQAKEMNPLGQVTREQMRNGVETVATRNPVTGWLLGSTATAHSNGDQQIQNWGYEFDEVGNLLSRTRQDGVNTLTSSESFTYDLTNRVTSSVLATSNEQSVSDSYVYDTAGLGNLMQKGGSTYTYGAGCQAGSRSAGPHAVCTVGGGTPFVYDGNGNLTNSGSRMVTYNASNKVTQITSAPTMSQGNDTGIVDLMYGADGNRVVQLVNSGSKTTRTVYVGLGATGKSLYERTTTSMGGTAGTIEHVHYIYAGGAHGGAAFALRVLDDTGTPTESRYYSFDHLGSVTAMSDELGRVSATGADATMYSYDVWGARRSADGTAASPASFNIAVGAARQFTGQEQIPDVGLVNMNGRLYDPALGRFLSPDPNIQAVGDLQSYNRYTYVRNNPLSYTDPTGYFWSELGHFFASTFGNPMNDIQLGFSLVACAAAGPAGCLLVGVYFAAVDASIAISAGAGWEQTVLGSTIGLGIGIATGGAGLEAWQGVILGAASAAVTTGITNSISGHDFFQANILGAAIVSAASSAAGMALQKVMAVSQAGAIAAQEDDRAWGGWGSRKEYDQHVLDTTLSDALMGLSNRHTMLAGLFDYVQPVATEGDIVDPTSGIPLNGNPAQMRAAIAAMAGGAVVAAGAAAGMALAAPELALAGGGLEVLRTRSQIFLDLWGQGVEGARNTLSSIESGAFKLAPDLTLDHLSWYATRAQNMINLYGDAYGGYMVQSLRLQIIQQVTPMVK